MLTPTPPLLDFGNTINESKNPHEILLKNDAIGLLKQGTNIMLGGGYVGDCHAQVFDELVLGFLYPGFFHRKIISGDKLRIVAPANYIFNGDGNTIDEILKTEEKKELLELFRTEYLMGHYSKKDFQKMISSFSYNARKCCLWRS